MNECGDVSAGIGAWRFGNGRMGDCRVEILWVFGDGHGEVGGVRFGCWVGRVTFDRDGKRNYYCRHL